jgi:hypothetical protein
MPTKQKSQAARTQIANLVVFGKVPEHFWPVGQHAQRDLQREELQWTTRLMASNDRL